MIETDGMIEKKSDRQKTVITIVKYEDFQDTRPQTDHEETADRPPADHQRDTNNNDNNENNDNKKDDDIKPDDFNLDPAPEAKEIQEICNHYIRRAGRFANHHDLKAMAVLFDDGIPLETIHQGIDNAFDYKEGRGETVNSFAYCDKVIRTLHEQQKGEGQHATRGGTLGNIHGRDQAASEEDPGIEESWWARHVK